MLIKKRFDVIDGQLVRHGLPFINVLKPCSDEHYFYQNQYYLPIDVAMESLLLLLIANNRMNHLDH